MTEILGYISDHLILLLISLLFSTAISLLLTLLIESFSKVRLFVLPVLSFIYTIPSLALFVLLIPFFGIGRVTAIIALTLYSSFILTSSFVTAFDSLDEVLIESARGMGYSEKDIFWKIKCIYALPQILSGLRLTTISIIAIASIAAVVNAGGLGALIFEGLSQQRYDKVILGSLIMAVLSILFNYIFSVCEQEVLAYIRGEKSEH